MIIHDKVEQGTEEWFDLRRGKFTASIASKMVTPTGRPSTTYRAEIGRIIAESMGWQEPEPFIQTEWMRRGTELEDEARKWFTVMTGFDVKEVGFVEFNGGMLGFSPDGLLDHPMMASIIPVEIKVPKPSTHIGWLLEGGLPKDHRAQVHFGMVITNAPHAYFMSYATQCEPLIIKVHRDDYTETMVKAINNYAAEFEAAYKTITGINYGEV